jgi:hypothetical protein
MNINMDIVMRMGMDEDMDVNMESNRNMPNVVRQ